MDRRGLLMIRAVTLPERLRGKLPPLGIGTDDVFGLSPQETDRLADEAAQADLLVRNAAPGAVTLLVRLAEAAPDGALLFPSVKQLERFLAALVGRDAAATSTNELAALWRRAGDGAR